MISVETSQTTENLVDITISSDECGVIRLGNCNPVELIELIKDLSEIITEICTLP